MVQLRTVRLDIIGLGIFGLLAVLAFGGGACTPSRSVPSGLTGLTARRAPERWTPSTGVIHRADLDTTTPPCHDFHQYATGGWYRRIPMQDRGDAVHGPDQSRAGTALRQFLAQAPVLAQTTTDPTLRTVGYFYGSCLTDATGTASGAIGDTSRASDCFRRTRQQLDRALYELMMEYVWSPDARAESRRFWEHMKAAAVARFKASRALSDSTKQQLIGLTAGIQLHAGEVTNAAWDSTTVLWRQEVRWPSGVRGPSDVPFAGPVILATWRYRDYEDLALSPSDFRGNLARLQAAPDTIPLPVMPAGLQRRGRGGDTLFVMNVLLGTQTYGAGVGNGAAALPLGMLVTPVVEGRVDVGAWYGTVGPVIGHEMSHGTWHGGGQSTPLTRASQAEKVAFAVEQFEEQLQGGREGYLGHDFDDAIGVLVAYDAFKRATQGQSGFEIDGFTQQQRFFLGVAHGWRGGLATVNPIDGQARWRVLTNGSLSTLPAFASAFKCSAGGPMTGAHVWFANPWSNIVPTQERRRQIYQDYIEQTFGESFGFTGLQFVRDPRILTEGQRTAFKGLKPLHTAQQQALLDSLESVVDFNADTRRILQLLARQIGERRAVLTPEQQMAFDPQAQQWRRRYRVEAAIPAVPH